MIFRHFIKVVTLQWNRPHDDHRSSDPRPVKLCLDQYIFRFLFRCIYMWSRALDVRLSEWCCSVSMVWVQILSREEQKSNSNTVWFNFQTYICKYIYMYMYTRFKNLIQTSKLKFDFEDLNYWIKQNHIIQTWNKCTM